MTGYMAKCLDKYEAEFRPNRPPIDRNLELDPHVLKKYRTEVRAMFCTSSWPPEKLDALAVCYLVAFGYDPETERRMEAELQAEGRELQRKYEERYGVQES